SRTMKASLLIATALAASVPSAADATADGCAVVMRTPDGFLNLRKLPTADSAVVARLFPGAMLDIDDMDCQKQGNPSVCRNDDVPWMHVTGVPRLKRKGRTQVSGWVRGKHVRMSARDGSTQELRAAHSGGLFISLERPGLLEGRHQRSRLVPV